MPPLRSKAQIIKRLRAERKRLEQNLAYLSPAEMLQPGVVGEWSAKDVLAHLAEWQAQMPVWIAAARRGERVESPAPGLTWKQLDIFNQRIYQAHREKPLAEVLEYFRTTDRQFMEMVESMAEDEMLAHSRYEFIGQGTVYDWLSAYAAHDLWGKKKIRQWLKAHDRLEKRP